MLLRCLPIALALLFAPSIVHAKPPRAVAVQGGTAEQRPPRQGKKAERDRAAKKAETRPAKKTSTPAGAAAKTPGKKKPATRANSVGPPNEGKLVGGVRLDTDKPHLRVVPLYAASDVRWGLPSLVAMIERAAAGVAKRYPGSRLDVGDLSRKHGGEVDRHHSHESGRDVDLGFYVVDKRGRLLHARTFQKIDASLRSLTVRGGRFDLARNWALVEMLLTDPTAYVSHILVAEHIRQALLAYARPRVSAKLYHRAALALMQPSQPLPHDDHMHVRISCPRGARDQCVELAKGAPSKARMAKRKTRERKPGVRTPPRTTKKRERSAPAASAAPTPRGGAARRTSFLDPEAEADAAEVRDALDETGLLRITE